MNKDHIKGTYDRAKGAAKEGTGKVLDDKKLEAEGKIDKAKGKVEHAVGDMKDKIRRATDS
jgi:uncharacterized protein YjbJ (UPF0337 family)